MAVSAMGRMGSLRGSDGENGDILDQRTASQQEPFSPTSTGAPECRLSSHASEFSLAVLANPMRHSGNSFAIQSASNAPVSPKQRGYNSTRLSLGSDMRGASFHNSAATEQESPGDPWGGPGRQGRQPCRHGARVMSEGAHVVPPDSGGPGGWSASGERQGQGVQSSDYDDWGDVEVVAVEHSHDSEHGGVPVLDVSLGSSPGVSTNHTQERRQEQAGPSGRGAVPVVVASGFYGAPIDPRMAGMEEGSGARASGFSGAPIDPRMAGMEEASGTRMNHGVSTGGWMPTGTPSRGISGDGSGIEHSARPSGGSSRSGQGESRVMSLRFRLAAMGVGSQSEWMEHEQAKAQPTATWSGSFMQRPSSPGTHAMSSHVHFGGLDTLARESMKSIATEESMDPFLDMCLPPGLMTPRRNSAVTSLSAEPFATSMASFSGHLPAPSEPSSNTSGRWLPTGPWIELATPPILSRRAGGEGPRERVSAPGIAMDHTPAHVRQRSRMSATPQPVVWDQEDGDAAGMWDMDPDREEEGARGEAGVESSWGRGEGKEDVVEVPVGVKRLGVEVDISDEDMLDEEPNSDEERGESGNVGGVADSEHMGEKEGEEMDKEYMGGKEGEEASYKDVDACMVDDTGMGVETDAVCGVKGEEDRLGDVEEEREAVGDVMEEREAMGDVKGESEAVGDVMEAREAMGDVKGESEAVGDVMEATDGAGDGQEREVTDALRGLGVEIGGDSVPVPTDSHSADANVASFGAPHFDTTWGDSPIPSSTSSSVEDDSSSYSDYSDSSFASSSLHSDRLNDSALPALPETFEGYGAAGNHPGEADGRLHVTVAEPSSDRPPVPRLRLPTADMARHQWDHSGAGPRSTPGTATTTVTSGRSGRDAWTPSSAGGGFGPSTGSGSSWAGGSVGIVGVVPESSRSMVSSKSAIEDAVDDIQELLKEMRHELFGVDSFSEGGDGESEAGSDGEDEGEGERLVGEDEGSGLQWEGRAREEEWTDWDDQRTPWGLAPVPEVAWEGEKSGGDKDGRNDGAGEGEGEEQKKEEWESKGEKVDGAKVQREREEDRAEGEGDGEKGLASQRERRAAVRIQSWERGRQARERVRAMRIQAEVARRTEAAIRIQRHERGRQARRRLRVAKDARAAQQAARGACHECGESGGRLSEECPDCGAAVFCSATCRDAGLRRHRALHCTADEAVERRRALEEVGEGRRGEGAEIRALQGYLARAQQARRDLEADMARYVDAQRQRRALRAAAPHNRPVSARRTPSQGVRDGWRPSSAAAVATYGTVPETAAADPVSLPPGFSVSFSSPRPPPLPPSASPYAQVPPGALRHARRIESVRATAWDQLSAAKSRRAPDPAPPTANHAEKHETDLSRERGGPEVRQRSEGWGRGGAAPGGRPRSHRSTFVPRPMSSRSPGALHTPGPRGAARRLEGAFEGTSPTEPRASPGSRSRARMFQGKGAPWSAGGRSDGGGNGLGSGRPGSHRLVSSTPRPDAGPGGRNGGPACDPGRAANGFHPVDCVARVRPGDDPIPRGLPSRGHGEGDHAKGGYGEESSLWGTGSSSALLWAAPVGGEVPLSARPLFRPGLGNWGARELEADAMVRLALGRAVPYTGRIRSPEHGRPDRRPRTAGGRAPGGGAGLWAAAGEKSVASGMPAVRGARGGAQTEEEGSESSSAVQGQAMGVVVRVSQTLRNGFPSRFCHLCGSRVARVETCSVTGMPHDRMRLHMVEEQMRKAACDEVYRQSMREAGEWIMGGGPGTE